MEHSIYLITNKLNGKKYVGATTCDPMIRWSQHYTGRSKCIALCAAIEKYGRKNFSFDIIYEIESDNKQEIFEKEKEFIKQYDSFAPNGYNLTYGGEGVTGHKHSEETKATIKAKRATQTFSEETRAKLSKAQMKGSNAYNLRYTTETRAKLSITSKIQRGKHNPRASKWLVNDPEGIPHEINDTTKYFGSSFKSVWESLRRNKPVKKGYYKGWQLIEIIKL